MRFRKKRVLLLAAAAIALAGVLCVVFYLLGSGRVIPQKTYTAQDFGISTVRSAVDFNKNGIDDFTDILLGARKDAENYPIYDGTYCAGGYPPENRGVCTDVIWRAFRQAGYSLKDMVSRDIKENPELYPDGKTPDPNIDFRRVGNLFVYFSRHAVSLTTDIKKIGEWQPGDIVVFQKHIGIISDRRSEDGTPYLIHNAGQPLREENALKNQGQIVGHFRFDASRLPSSDLIAFQ